MQQKRVDKQDNTQNSNNRTLVFLSSCWIYGKMIFVDLNINANKHKMIKLLLIVILAFPIRSFSQQENLVFHYEVQKNFLVSNYDLMMGNNVCVWKETTDPSQIEFNPTYMPEEDYKREILFKTLREKIVYSDYNILGSDFYLKDSLHVQNWTLIDDEPEDILGYTCKKAKTNFRGRNYEALYTTEIAINNGPWKFGGLPGMILKITSESNDEVYKMECVGIETHNQKNKELLDAFLKKRRKKKFLNWSEFVKDFNLFLDRYIKSLKSEVESEGDGGFTLQFSIDNYLEIFSKEVQTDGILLEF